MILKHRGRKLKTLGKPKVLILFHPTMIEFQLINQTDGYIEYEYHKR
jgi:hypothetical protein